jgi:hypothetical protein
MPLITNCIGGFMNKYEIRYFNNLTQEDAFFYALAKNEKDAERIFQKMYNLEIEDVAIYTSPHFFTEEEVNEFVSNYRKKIW